MTTSAAGVVGTNPFHCDDDVDKHKKDPTVIPRHRLLGKGKREGERDEYQETMSSSEIVSGKTQ